MKIGIVGAGKIGGLIGTFWSRAGHAVMFASRHPESLADLVKMKGSERFSDFLPVESLRGRQPNPA